jgi:hypothetical protein
MAVGVKYADGYTPLSWSLVSLVLLGGFIDFVTQGCCHPS